MAENLKQKAAAGMIWSALEKYSTMLISFVSGIILARLLTPHDYGCIGMLAIFMVIASTFVDGGFASALIQKKRPTQTDYSTIFWWNMGMSSFMYLLLFVCAPVIASFYNLPLLSSVLRVQGLVLFINAFKIIQSNQLRKTINFKAIAITSVTTATVSLFVTVLLAYNGFGVWALVTQNIISASIPAIVYWFYVKWRPSWIFSWQSFKGLFSFGGYMFLTHLINSFGQKIQGVLIGKAYSSSTMGYYAKAEGTEDLASTSISSIMAQVTYPLYAEVQDDKNALSNMIRRMQMTLAYITFPLMFVLLLCAKPVFLLLYSDRWIQSVPYFQVLCFAGLASCLQAVNLQAISAIGKSKAMFVWTFIKRTVGISAVVIGLTFWGMKGLLAGVILNHWFSLFININLVSKHIGYKFWRQIGDLFPIALTSLISLIVSYGIGHILNLSLYADGLVKVMAFLIIYLSWSFVFKPEAYTYFLTVLPNIFGFIKKFKHSKHD